MDQNPVEDNFVTRFILGVAVVFGMMVGGQVVGTAFLSFGFKYAKWIGVLVGAALVFVVFTVLYKRYDESFTSE